VSGETFCLEGLEGAVVELTLGRRVLPIWVLVAKIFDDFILRLDVQRL
jgi:hypothetical protein